MPVNRETFVVEACRQRIMYGTQYRHHQHALHGLPSCLAKTHKAHERLVSRRLDDLQKRVRGPDPSPAEIVQACDDPLESSPMTSPALRLRYKPY